MLIVGLFGRPEKCLIGLQRVHTTGYEMCRASIQALESIRNLEGQLAASYSYQIPSDIVIHTLTTEGLYLSSPPLPLAAAAATTSRQKDVNPAPPGRTLRLVAELLVDLASSHVAIFYTIADMYSYRIELYIRMLWLELP